MAIDPADAIALDTLRATLAETFTKTARLLSSVSDTVDDVAIGMDGYHTLFGQLADGMTLHPDSFAERQQVAERSATMLRRLRDRVDENRKAFDEALVKWREKFPASAGNKES